MFKIEKFLYDSLCNSIKYEIFLKPIYQFENNKHCKSGICDKCHQQQKLSLSHSISSAWYSKNNQTSKIIFSADYDPIASANNKQKDIYKVRQLFFSNQEKHGDQYNQIYLKIFISYLQNIYSMPIFYNLFEECLNNFQYYIYSTFSTLCQKCDQKYKPLDNINFLNDFNLNTNCELLLERFEYYIGHKQNYTGKFLDITKTVLSENIESIFNNYLNNINFITLNKKIYIEQAKIMLLKLRNDLIKSKVGKHIHSFILCLEYNSDLKDYISLSLADEDFYNKIYYSFINIVESFLNNTEQIEVLFNQLDFIHINSLHTNLITYKNNIDKYLNNDFKKYPLNSDLSEYSHKSILKFKNKIKFYGFNKISLSYFNILDKKLSFTENDYIYTFISPSDDSNQVISYMVKPENYNIIDCILHSISEKYNFDFEQVNRFLFFYSFIIDISKLSIYSNEREFIEMIIKFNDSLVSAELNYKENCINQNDYILDILNLINDFIEKKLALC